MTTGTTTDAPERIPTNVAAAGAMLGMVHGFRPSAEFGDKCAEWLARFGAKLAAAVAEHRAAWKANREAVRARRIAAVRALAAVIRHQLDALYLCEPTPVAVTVGRRHRLDLEPSPPPLYVASLANVPNAPPALVASTTPLGETT